MKNDPHSPLFITTAHFLHFLSTLQKTKTELLFHLLLQLHLFSSSPVVCVSEMNQFSITTTTTTTTTITTTITTTTHHFSSLVFSYFILFCSLILSHPLYFSYFIFFSPYLLKLISFLSPLFITTSLFLLAFLTFHNPFSQHSESKLGFFLGSYQKVLNRLSWSADDENDQTFHLFEELEACMVVLENDSQCYGFSDLSKELALHVEDKPEEEFIQKKSEAAIVSLELSHPQLPQLTSKSHVEEEEDSLTKQPSDHDKEHKVIIQLQPLREAKEYKENLEMQYSTALTPCGSMRKEKEWKRTLACKLYEERQNIDGCEGMDSLWEEYDTDTGKKMNKSKVKKETEFDEDDEEEDEIEVNLCCLQALKFSTGKMNIGMKKPNLVKISKALKGFGWFHHVSKQGKDRVK